MWSVYDVGSSYQWVYFSKSKEAAVVIQILQLVIADLLFFEKILKVVRSDAEEIFSSREVISFLQSKESNLSSQFLISIIRIELRGLYKTWLEVHSQRFLPASCWEYAAKHYVKISRFLPTKKTKPDIWIYLYDFFLHLEMWLL